MHIYLLARLYKDKVSMRWNILTIAQEKMLDATT